MRVLIADDQPGVGGTLALLVAAARHHVVKVVSSGAEAIRNHIVELFLFVLIAGLSAWPIISMIVALIRLVRNC